MEVKVNDIITLKEAHYCKNNEFIVVKITNIIYLLKCKKCQRLIRRIPSKFRELLDMVNGEPYAREIYQKPEKELSWSEEIQRENWRIARSIERWEYRHTTEKDTLDYRVPGSFENGKRR